MLMLRERRNPADPHDARRPAKRQSDLWIEVYSPDTALVERVSGLIKAWMREHLPGYTGPAVQRRTRYFSLFDYADSNHLVEDRPTWCLVHRFGAFGVTDDHVDALQQMISPTGVRIMVRTRGRKGPPVSIPSVATSNWRDE